MINLGKMPKEHKPLFSSPGSKEKPIYKYVMNEKYGCPRRYVAGKTNLQDYIQQSKDDVDFKSIGKMLVDNRENVISHFDMNGEIVDVTGHPRDIHELNDLEVKMRNSFKSLEPDLQAQFDNDFDIFASNYKSGRLSSIIQNYYDKKAADAQKVVEKKEGAE